MTLQQIHLQEIVSKFLCVYYREHLQSFQTVDELFASVKSEVAKLPAVHCRVDVIKGENDWDETYMRLFVITAASEPLRIRAETGRSLHKCLCASCQATGFPTYKRRPTVPDDGTSAASYASRWRLGCGMNSAEETVTVLIRIIPPHSCVCLYVVALPKTFAN